MRTPSSRPRLSRIKHIIFASRSIGLNGGITSVIDDLAEEFTKRGYMASYISIHDPHGRPRVPGEVFHVNKYWNLTIDHPMELKRPSTGTKRLLKKAMTPAWRRWRRRRVARQLRQLGPASCIIFANPETLEEVVEAGYLQATDKEWLPLMALHIHTSPAGLRSLGAKVSSKARKLCDIAVAIHPTYREPIERWAGIPTVTIGNPCTTKANSTEAPAEKERQRLVYMGRLSAEKRPDWAIKAFNQLSPQFPEWELHLYGEKHPDPSLTTLAKNGPATGRIHFHEWTNEPELAFRSASLHLMPSAFEGLGLSAIVAARCHTPTVSLPIEGALSSIVSECGFLARHDSLESFTEAVELAMSRPELRAERRVKCASIGKHFDVSRVVDEWCHAFNSLSEKTGSRQDAAT